MLQPEDLRAFVAVFDASHFVRAADGLGTSQSTVSKRLLRLEDQLGVRLIERGKRHRVQPTREGVLFVAEARRMLAEHDGLERFGRNLARGAVGPIRIGFVFSAIMTGILPCMIRALRTAIEHIEIEPRSMETPEQLVAVGTGELDFGLTRPRPFYPEGVLARMVHRERVVLAVSDEHPLAESTEIQPQGLAGVRFIVPQFHEEVGLIDIIRDLAKAGGLPMPEIIRTADFITAAGLASAGEGIAAVPASLSRLQLDGLRYREISGPQVSMDLMLISRRNAPARASEILHASVSPAH